MRSVPPAIARRSRLQPSLKYWIDSRDYTFLVANYNDILFLIEAKLPHRIDSTVLSLWHLLCSLGAIKSASW